MYLCICEHSHTVYLSWVRAYHRKLVDLLVDLMTIHSVMFKIMVTLNEGTFNLVFKVMTITASLRSNDQDSGVWQSPCSYDCRGISAPPTCYLLSPPLPSSCSHCWPTWPCTRQLLADSAFLLRPGENEQDTLKPRVMACQEAPELQCGNQIITKWTFNNPG